MIEKYTLKSLLDEYNIDSDKLINKNNNILTYGEYQEIKAMLDYLINELKVATKKIEKCPSVLYRNPEEIKTNINFLQKTEIKFPSIEACLHVLSTDSQQLSSTYEYVKENYGIDVINKVTSILGVPKNKIISLEKLNIPLKNKNDIISIAIGRNSVEEIKNIINSPEFKEYPELFTSEVLARSSLEDIQEIIHSPEFKERPKLFTSQVLARASLKDIQEIIHSPEFKEHPELFTSTVLAQATLKDIQEIIHSPEFKEHPKLFTSQVLAKSSLKDIQEIIDSSEFKDHPELFTSQVLAHASLKDIQEIIQSSEFKDHPELFTSTVLAHASLKDIQEIIHSSEFKEYPELFTSTVLAQSSLKDIQSLLELPYWENPKYKILLTSSVVANSKVMIKKLPVLFQLAEAYEINDCLNTNFLRKSPSQNYALINYLVNNKINLVENGKLNKVFSYAPGALRKKYNIDINQLMSKYPMPVNEKEKEGRRL